MHLLLALLLLWAPPAGAVVIDRVVVVVESEIVLASEVRFEDELTRLDEAPVPLWRRQTARALDRLVDAAVVRAVAADVALYQPARAEVEQRLEAVRRRFPDRATWERFLARWGLDEEGLELALRRRMVVERFLLRNVQAAPSDELAWLTQAEALVARLQERVRIREVPREEAAP